MKTTFDRNQRIADLIQREVATLLRTEAHDPRFMQVTITGAKVAPDLSSAKIYFTLSDENELASTLKALKKAAGFLRHNLAKNASLRKTPAIQFVYDESVARGQRLTQLLDSAE